MINEKKKCLNYNRNVVCQRTSTCLSIYGSLVPIQGFFQVSLRKIKWCVRHLGLEIAGFGRRTPQIS